MKAQRTPEERAMRAEVRAHLCQILKTVAGHDGSTLTVRCCDDAHHLTLTIQGGKDVTPAPSASPPLPAMFFSPAESAIINAIGPLGILLGKNVEKATGLPLTSDMKTLLRNLKDRGVLACGEGGQGYRWSDEFRRLRGLAS